MFFAWPPNVVPGRMNPWLNSAFACRFLIFPPQAMTIGAMSISRGSNPGFISRQVVHDRRFYFGHAAAFSNGELELLCGGWELVDKDYVISRDTFPWLGLEFVASGRGQLWMDGAVNQLQRGVVFAYGPGVPHRIETEPDDVLSKYYLSFSGDEAANLMSAARIEPGDCRLMGNADEIEEAFEVIIDEGTVDRLQSPAIAGLQLRILLLKLLGTHETDLPAERRSRQMLRKCLSHMNQHFLKIRTVQEVAIACHVSVGHLTRIFVRHGYGPPYQYLTRRKMLHAAALLDSGMLMVREVADRLGLDQFQFSRVFKRVHGISPSEFSRRRGNG